MKPKTPLSFSRKGRTKTKVASVIFIAVLVAWTFLLVQQTLATLEYSKRTANVGVVNLPPNCTWTILLTTDEWFQDGTMEEANVIDWGNFPASGYFKDVRGTDVLINGEHLAKPELVIKNEGDVPIYLGWNVTDLSDSSITVTAIVEDSYGNNVWGSWEPNTYHWGPVQPGNVWGRIIFQVRTTENTPSGPFSFTININVANTNYG